MFTHGRPMKLPTGRLPAPNGTYKGNLWVPSFHVPTVQGFLTLSIDGYTVPEGTITIPNLYAMHTSADGDFAPNPMEYDPEGHFLDADGVVRRPAGFMPFGGGRRVCLGEQLARNELFLIAVALLRRVKFLAVPGETYSLEPDANVDVALYSRPFKVIVEARN